MKTLNKAFEMAAVLNLLRVAICVVAACSFLPSESLGQNWMPANVSNGVWYAIALSADGSCLAAGMVHDSIYISTDSGTTWAPSDAPTKQWTSIACSADGKSMAAVSLDDDVIYLSTNTGSTWNPVTNGPKRNWLSIASSRDGTKIFAAADTDAFLSEDSGIYASTNSGKDWALSDASLAVPW
ncbi:MAG TPA: hypothetical protein VH255_05625, partial [Verrucomicrobiae bacterium]|nr:hypothetical protein [Verrucomicrobiae bacterium]